MELWKQHCILRVEKGSAAICEDALLLEEEILLFVNGRFYVSFDCIPADLEELAAGYALCRGLLCCREEISSIYVGNGRIDLTITSTHSRPAPAPALILEPEQVYTLWEEFDGACAAFYRTGAAHAVGLAGAGGLAFVREDAARHNALAKVLGAALLAGIPTCDKALIFSGRMSGELMEMASICEAPILLCHGAATLLAVERAEELGITLAGFVRRGYMNLYTHSERIIRSEHSFNKGAVNAAGNK